MRRLIYAWPLFLAVLLTWMLTTSNAAAVRQPTTASAATTVGAPAEYGAAGWTSVYGASGTTLYGDRVVGAAEVDGLLLGAPGVPAIPDPVFAGQPGGTPLD
jgi:hypothetical protein